MNFQAASTSLRQRIQATSRDYNGRSHAPPVDTWVHPTRSGGFLIGDNRVLRFDDEILLRLGGSLLTNSKKLAGAFSLHVD